MIRFNCNGRPYVDPLHEFTIDDWPPFGNSKEGEPKTQTDIDMPTIIGGLRENGFKIKHNQSINTSIFEEAEIIE